MDAGQRAAGGLGGLRDDLPGGHHRRVSDREPRADEYAAAAEARTFYDLVIEVAIVRPGPIQGKMVHPYLRRRDGEEPVEYPNQQVRGVLHRTLGAPLFQEQAMQLAMVAGGFSPGEADQLRRAMAGWRRPGLIDQFRRKLLAGMQANGYDDAYAERVFNQIRGFGEYGFPGVARGQLREAGVRVVLAEAYFPAAFTAALLNSQPMGFYAPAQLVQDARRHEAPVRPIDVNHSHWDCTLEPTATDSPAMRLGLRMVAGLKRFELRTTPKRQGIPSSHVKPQSSIRIPQSLLDRQNAAESGLSLPDKIPPLRFFGVIRRQPSTLLAHSEGDSLGESVLIAAGPGAGSLGAGSAAVERRSV